MSYHADKLVITAHTDAGNDNTRRPKLALGKNAIWYVFFQVVYHCFYVIFNNWS